MLTLIYLILASIVSFIIAANNSADSVGTLYGSGIISYYKAAIYSGAFVMLGTFLEGWKMAGAIGGGIVVNPLTLEMSLMVLITSAILLFLFTYLSMPLSASQILVGSIIGVAFAYAMVISIEFITLIIFSWILTLVVGVGFSYLIYKIISILSRKMRIFSLSKFYLVSLYAGSAFIAYTLGANTIGLVASLNLSTISILVAGIASFFGTFLMGKRTVITVGKKITLLDPPRAFSAQVAGALIVEIFTQLHFPVSITQAVIGGVIGTGLIKGYRELNKRTVGNLAISWTMAPILSFLITVIIVKVASLL